MKKSLPTLLAAMALTICATASADEYNRIFVVGDATLSGWSLDAAQALLAKPEASKVYNGTLYLKNTDDFKFLSVPEFDEQEFGLAAGESTPVSGEFKLAEGNDDKGYGKLSVATSGNYYIVVDTENLTGSITLSDYQDTQITYSSLYLVGEATTGGWSVDEGTPLYQEKETPYIFSSETALKEGSFKIANAVKGGGSWEQKYYYFRDANDEGKISTDGTDDRQWTISKAATYNVTVNTVAQTISIKEAATNAVDIIEAADCDVTPVYYNLQGQKVANPDKGIFIKVTGNNAEKVIL